MIHPSVSNWMDAVNCSFRSIHIEEALERGEVYYDSEFGVYTYLDGLREGLRRAIPAEADHKSCLDYLDRVIRAKITLALEVYNAKEAMAEKNSEA